MPDHRGRASFRGASYHRRKIVEPIDRTHRHDVVDRDHERTRARQAEETVQSARFPRHATLLMRDPIHARPRGDGTTRRDRTYPRGPPPPHNPGAPREPRRCARRHTSGRVRSGTGSPGALARTFRMRPGIGGGAMAITTADMRRKHRSRGLGVWVEAAQVAGRMAARSYGRLRPLSWSLGRSGGRCAQI